MSYVNADGLHVITFKDQGEVNKTGVTVESGVQTIVFTIADAATDIGATAEIGAGDAFIPANSYIKSAIFVVDSAFTSDGAATLDIGTYTKAGVDVQTTGIDAAIALTAIDAAGDVVVNDGSQVAPDNVTAFDMYLGMKYNAAAFTGGAGKLVVEYLTL